MWGKKSREIRYLRNRLQTDVDVRRVSSGDETWDVYFPFLLFNKHSFSHRWTFIVVAAAKHSFLFF